MVNRISPLNTILLHLAGLLILNSSLSFSQSDLKFEQNQTMTWSETINFYQSLETNYSGCKLITAGETDSGKPLHLFIISGNEVFDPLALKKQNKCVMMINNGIHPGEPCGIDASAKFAKEVLENTQEYKEVLENTVILIIPILNIGGALNRGEFHRANQNGPLEHGFRANSMNMDLNREFIKLDTKNVKSFVEIFQKWDPDILIDTHTSNGADYQYTITVIANQKDKLDPGISEYLYDRMLPKLSRDMKETPFESIPYVMSYDNRNPENGIIAFMDYPRYTTGYASLFNTISFTLETHMFKEYKDRVLSTYYYIMHTAQFLSENAGDIQNIRNIAKENSRNKSNFVLGWELDTSYFETINFKGYEIKYKTSKVSGQETYYFDRESPWEKPIKNYTQYKPVLTVNKPDFYIIPQAWGEVINRLKLNGVEMTELTLDTTLEVDYYYIRDYKTYPQAYNGHYKHSNIMLEKYHGALPFFQGDYLIPTNQISNEYIVQVLEPEGEDSFFSWNFFDAILSRKEYFSPYVFDDKAADILKNDPDLALRFEKMRTDDPNFGSNHYAQLRFIYENSEYSEKSYNRYPVTRYFLNQK
ncbi:MAG: hypothetical protein K9H49_07995 [Bacteroidales bacterium]|nr:hypothetical protein [Bacteroidales bacterium]MCF8390170.1 hypothetical protein [Bacteroidales bacterium]